MNRTSVRPLLAIMAAGCASPAFAHVGLGPAPALASGFAHPFSGLDHAAAMVAVGLWAALRGGSAPLAWPAAFVGVMLCGCAAAMAGIPVPFVEPGILASLVVLGLLAALAADVPVAAGAAIVAAFAFFHGHAHGAELPLTAGALPYLAGFVSATVILHAAGVAMGRLAAGRLARFAGAATAIAGLGMAAGVF